MSGRSLGQKSDEACGYTTGFDALRVGLAIGILCFHSIFVTQGTDAAAWSLPFRPLTTIMLPMFFALSGYLVAGSLLRVETIAQFLTLRALRIVPALFVEVILCALVLGPIVTKLPLSEYFSAEQFWSYWMNIVGLVRFVLPGVFTENPRAIVNLSLWTVPFELECYIGLTLIASATMLRRPRALLVIFAVLTIAVIAWQAQLGFSWSRPEGKSLVVAFLAGVVLHTWRDRIPHSIGLFAASSLLSLTLLSTPHTAAIAAMPVAYCTVFLGLTNPPRVPLFWRGDYSYGIYLYAFPMQQFQAWLTPDQRIWWVNIIFALPASILWAVMSWHLIEKPVLSRKRAALQVIASVERSRS